MGNPIDRKKIGIVFQYNEGWIGGSYYILNLIEALHTLPDVKKPVLYIFTSTEKEYAIVQATGYPYLVFKLGGRAFINQTYKNWEQKINAVSKRIFGRYLINRNETFHYLDAVFPYQNLAVLQHLPKNRRIYWIPDFQDLYYPEFFSSKELATRKKRYHSVAYAGHNKLVLSSEAAKNDFNKFFPNNKATTHVVNFAVTHPVLQDISVEQLKDTYPLSNKYFFAPNQFWKHKNQRVILEALKILNHRGVAVQVLFSGKMSGSKDIENYVDGLKEKIGELGVEENVKFLGFIPREHQLAIMKYSFAVIQPSLFEGWSTVIEDAKALGKTIIASNLDVHKEQLGREHPYLFSPTSGGELATCIETLLTKPISATNDIDNNYDFNKGVFAESFLAAMEI